MNIKLIITLLATLVISYLTTSAQQIKWALDGSYTCVVYTTKGIWEPTAGCRVPTQEEIKEHSSYNVSAPRIKASPKLGTFIVYNEPIMLDAAKNDDGSRIDTLSQDEYDTLSKLRQAVKDEESEILLAHRVIVSAFNIYEPYPQCKPNFYVTISSSGNYACMKTIPADKYEFRGRYLLINVPQLWGH